LHRFRRKYEVTNLYFEVAKNWSGFSENNWDGRRSISHSFVETDLKTVRLYLFGFRHVSIEVRCSRELGRANSKQFRTNNVQDIYMKIVMDFCNGIGGGGGKIIGDVNVYVIWRRTRFIKNHGKKTGRTWVMKKVKIGNDDAHAIDLSPPCNVLVIHPVVFY